MSQANNSPFAPAPMMEVLGLLQHLRHQLREAVTKLADEAEREPKVQAALSCVHLLTECQKLERLIGMLSDEALNSLEPGGLA